LSYNIDAFKARASSSGKKEVRMGKSKNLPKKEKKKPKKEKKKII
jgi:hypothetical protein